MNPTAVLCRSTGMKEALPVRAERASDLSGDTGNRTPDLLLAKQALYQLSYVPEGCPAVKPA